MRQIGRAVALEGDDRPFVSGLHGDEGGDRQASGRGAGDHRGALDALVAVEGALDLAELDAVAAFFHHPVAPAVEVVAPRAVVGDDVAGPIPGDAVNVAEEGQFGQVGTAEIALHHAGAGNHQLALLSRRHDAAGLIHHPSPQRRANAADREGLRAVAGDRGGDRLGRADVCLRRAVKVPQLGRRPERPQSLQRRDREDLASEEDESRSAAARMVEAAMSRQQREDRRR